MQLHTLIRSLPPSTPPSLRFTCFDSVGASVITSIAPTIIQYRAQVECTAHCRGLTTPHSAVRVS